MSRLRFLRAAAHSNSAGCCGFLKKGACRLCLLASRLPLPQRSATGLSLSLSPLPPGLSPCLCLLTAEDSPGVCWCLLQARLWSTVTPAVCNRLCRLLLLLLIAA